MENVIQQKRKVFVCDRWAGILSIGCSHINYFKLCASVGRVALASATPTESHKPIEPR